MPVQSWQPTRFNAPQVVSQGSANPPGKLSEIFTVGAEVYLPVHLGLLHGSGGRRTLKRAPVHQAEIQTDTQPIDVKHAKPGAELSHFLNNVSTITAR